MPVALTDMRWTKLEFLGSPDRTEAGGQEQPQVDRNRPYSKRLPGKTRGEEVKSKQGISAGRSGM